MTPAWVCPSCQTLNPPGNHFCLYCRTPDPSVRTINAAPNVDASPPTVAPNKIVMAVVIGFILVFGVVCSLIATRQGSAPSTKPAAAAPPTPDTLSAKEHLTKAKQLLVGASPDYGAAREHLMAIQGTAKEYGEAQRFRAQVDKLEAEKKERETVAARQAFAGEAEGHFLDAGFDVHVTVSGRNSTAITFRYVLMSRPTVYKIQQDYGFMERLRSLGFKKLIFTDGYDESWTVDL